MPSAHASESIVDGCQMDMRCQDGTNTWYLRYLAAADGWAREGEGERARER